MAALQLICTDKLSEENRFILGTQTAENNVSEKIHDKDKILNVTSE